LIDEEGNAALKLRVFVQGGGCSGFQYGFTFDEVVNEDDTAMERNGVTLLIDSMSYQYLVGAEIDYKDDIEGAQFVIKNSQRHHDLRLRVFVLRVDPPFARFPRSALWGAAQKKRAPLAPVCMKRNDS